MGNNEVSTTPQVENNVEVANYLRERIAERTGHGVNEVTSDSVLVDLGLQSIDAVLVCGEVEDFFGIELDPAMIFEHETLGSFTTAVTLLVDQG